MPRSYVTRAEALALLRIKAATLYTYVSRGWIRRVPGPDAKQSLYYREDIEKIRARSGARTPGSLLAAGAMRYGEPVVPTAVTEITAEGPRYRRRAAVDLVAAGVSFEGVAELLWTGLLLQDAPWSIGPLPAPMQTIAKDLHRLGDTVTMHDAFVMMTAAAGIAAGTPAQRMADSATPTPPARRLILALTGCFGLVADARRYRAPRPGETVAAAIAGALGIETRPATLRALDAALVLAADHELNPATFVARIAASGDSDVYACIAAALCANSGLRIARACDVLETYFRGPLSPATLVPRANGTAEAHDAASRAFDHPLYPDGDPRARCLLAIARGIDRRSTRMRNIFRYLDAAEERYERHARLEASLAVLSIALGLPAGAAGGVFALGRVAGWVAHSAEQRLAGFLIRPRARFAGAGPGDWQDEHDTHAYGVERS